MVDDTELFDVPLPERLLIGRLSVGGELITVASYHAPPGVSWHEKKPQQAVTFARWLATQTGPVMFGADANTPETDHPDLARNRTHWHTGDRHLKGAPGDDQLVGPTTIHQLRDALRCWFQDHPEQLELVRKEFPSGPLRVSHYTGCRRIRPGNPRQSTLSGSANTSPSRRSTIPTNSRAPPVATIPPSSPTSPSAERTI